MKLSSPPAPRTRAHFPAFALAALASLAAPSVAQPPRDARPGPAAQPAAAQNLTTAQPSSRERRAQAYVKLLEGQRYFEGIRSGTLTLDSLRKAQSAFQQAAELDPSLSEARAALAEIHLILNDLKQAEAEGLAAVRANPDSYGGHRTLARVYTLQSGLADKSLEEAVLQSRLTGQSTFNIQSTPTFIINGKVLRGAKTLEEFRAVIARELVP